MNKDINEILEYLKTVFLTIFIAAIVVAIMVVDLRINVGKKKSVDYHIKELTNIRLSLDELFYLEKQNPNDFMINLKIAFLYEVLKDSQNAQIHYEKALSKSNDNPFALYKAAMFYASQKQYHDAITYISLIPEQGNKKYYELKARFYSKLGEEFLEDEDFPNSIKVYKMSLKYAKNTNADLEKKVKKDYAHAYNEFAEKFINEDDPQHAILMLENALEVFPDPYAMYKLGLIYQNVNDVKALHFIENAYNIKPEIVNIEIYNKLLNKLIERYRAEGEYSKSRFYGLKSDNFKRKIINSNIFEGDIEIQDLKIFTHRKFIIGKKQYFAMFDIKNNSNYPLDNLFIKLIIHPQGGEKSESELKVISRSNPIAEGKTSYGIEIPINSSKLDSISKYAEIQILARKDVRSPWTMIDYLTVSFTK